LKESGFALSAATTTGLYGPRGLPADFVRGVHEAVTSLLSNPATVEKLAAQTMTPRPANSAEMAIALAQESKHYEELVKASGYVKERA